MNYLAHAYFSHNEPGTIIGNLISDFIKGKKQFDYPPEIQKGIRLHRAIDMFTDSHPAIGDAKQIFRPHYRLYAGAFVDVAFDYFLANDIQLFPAEYDLQLFSQRVYAAIDEYNDWLPEHTKGYFARMQEQNWLYNYRYVWGMEKSFAGVVYRSAYLNDSSTAVMLFEENLFHLKDSYMEFIPDLKQMVDAFRMPE